MGGLFVVLFSSKSRLPDLLISSGSTCICRALSWCLAVLRPRGPATAAHHLSRGPEQSSVFLVSAHRPPVLAHILLRAMRKAGAGTQGEGEHTHSPPHGPRQMGRQTDRQLPILGEFTEQADSGRNTPHLWGDPVGLIKGAAAWGWRVR